MTALPPDAVADLYKLVAELEQQLESSFAAHDAAIARVAATAQENARLRNELGVARDRQNASADILRVISQSPTDVQPVFDAIVLTAVRLLRCDMAFVLRCDGAAYSPAAAARPEGPMVDPGPANLPIDPDANFPSRAIVEKKILHLPDWSLIDLPEHERRIHEIFGVNSALYLPLLRDGECIGLLTLGGKQPGTFGENEIAFAEILPRPGRDCDRECAAVQQDQRSAVPADRDRRHPEGHRQFADGRAAGVRSDCRKRQALARRLFGCECSASSMA